MGFGNPGSIFIGASKRQDQEFYAEVFRNAKKRGYNRIVEPFAGCFALSYLAIGCGWNPEQIEASDVSFISAVYGRAINGASLSDMNINAYGFSEEELLDPAVAVYAHMYIKTAVKSGADYYKALLDDLKYNKEQHIERINSFIQDASRKLKGMSYRDLDAIKHIQEVKDDPKTIIAMYPPTYLNGYEKLFDTKGFLKWNEPEYEMFDPKTGIDEIFEMTNNSKALIVCGMENDLDGNLHAPLYARYEGKKKKVTYIASNRPEEAEELAGGKWISRKDEEKLSPLKINILPREYKVTKDTKVKAIPIKAENATYYRKLRTHNFSGGGVKSWFRTYIRRLYCRSFWLQ